MLKEYLGTLVLHDKMLCTSKVCTKDIENIVAGIQSITNIIFPFSFMIQYNKINKNKKNNFIIGYLLFRFSFNNYT